VRFAYFNLGHQENGSVVSVSLGGSAANVVLLNPANFARYRAGQAFAYFGGYFTEPQAEITVPEDGHWFVVVDHGGYRGHARARVSVRVAGAEGEHEHDPELLDDDALRVRVATPLGLRARRRRPSTRVR
jgi:hypothetical protein